MTQIISFVQQKGGVGKTTLLTVLAGLMATDEAKVLICDTDPQKNASTWAENTNLDNIQQGTATDEKALDNAITWAKSENYDIVMIDTAGIDTAFAQYVLSESDLVILPFDTGHYDLNGVLSTLDRIEVTAKMCRKLIKTALVANRYNAQHNVSKEIVDALKNKGNGYNILYKCPYLTGFKQMSGGGLPNGNALQSGKQFLATLQIENLLEYYNK